MDMSHLVGRLLIQEISLPSESFLQSDNIAGAVFTAVKNSPFSIHLRLDTSVLFSSDAPNVPLPATGAHPLTLSNVNIEALLLYDNAEEKVSPPPPHH